MNAMLKGRGILHFYNLYFPATRFSYEHRPDHLDHGDSTRTPLFNAHGVPCGIIVKCRYVFLCSAKVLRRSSVVGNDIVDWIEFEFDEFTRVLFFLILHPRNGLWERVALCIITWEAFESARLEWEDILLA